MGHQARVARGVTEPSSKFHTLPSASRALIGCQLLGSSHAASLRVLGRAHLLETHHHVQLVHILKAAGSALAAAAKEVEGSPAGAAVATDAKKTVSDAATAAVGYVQQNAAPAATKALTDVLTKVGVPAVVAACWPMSASARARRS